MRSEGVQKPLSILESTGQPGPSSARETQEESGNDGKILERRASREINSRTMVLPYRVCVPNWKHLLRVNNKRHSTVRSYGGG